MTTYANASIEQKEAGGCSNCGYLSAYYCDHKSNDGLCNKPLCFGCAVDLGDGKHVCEEHEEAE